MTDNFGCCKGCNGTGWVTQDWDEEAENFGQDTPCPHCDARGDDFFEHDE